MESTETKPASTSQPQLPPVEVPPGVDSVCLAEMKQIAELCKRLEGEPQCSTATLSSQVQHLRHKRRTSAKYRREVEDSFYDWLTAVPSDDPLECEQEQELSEGQAAKFASWVVGVSDRRVREPILKRLHVAATSMSGQEQTRFLESVQDRLIRLVRVAPSQESAALSSILGLVAWQGESEVVAEAAVIFGRSQDPDNVLLKLVAGAINAGLPTSAWAGVMNEYSLTQLRSG